MRHVREAHPNVTVIARAFDRLHYYRLREAGAHTVVRELFPASVEAARAALVSLGFGAERAARMVRAFERHDEATLEALYADYVKEPDVIKNQDYISRSRAAQDTLADVLAKDAPTETAEKA